jgi:hypothetical protein
MTQKGNKKYRDILTRDAEGTAEILEGREVMKS